MTCGGGIGADPASQASLAKKDFLKIFAKLDPYFAAIAKDNSGCSRSLEKKMLKSICAAAVCTASVLVLAPAAQAATEFSVLSWPDGLKYVPCAAFNKLADGTWEQAATIHVGGANARELTGTRYKNTSQSRILETRCGAVDQQAGAERAVTQ